MGSYSLWWRRKEKHLKQKREENKVSEGLGAKVWERRWTIRR